MSGRVPHKGMRSCAGCRARHPAEALLFLARRERRIFVSLSRPAGLAGRGLYCCPAPQCMERVLKRFGDPDSLEESFSASLEALAERARILGSTAATTAAPQLERIERTTRMMEVVLKAHRKRRRP